MAEDIIGFGDLFDFSDETPIRKGLEAIERLDKGYAQFIRNAIAQNKQLREELNRLASEMKKASGSLDNVNTASKKGRDEASRLAAEVNKQTKQYSDLKLKLQEQVNKTRELSKEHRNLQKSYTLLSRAQQKQAADSKRIATKEAEAQISIARKEAEARIAVAKKRSESEIRLEEDLTKAQRRESERRIKQAEKEAKEQQRQAERAAEEAAERGGTGSINDLRYRRNEAIKTYSRMGQDTPELARTTQINQINNMTKALQDQQAALALARRGAVAATDSYQGLVQANARIMSQLRTMPGAFNTITGEINENNQAAAAMARQYRQNTDALRRFDQQLGMNYRNVGNYQTAVRGMAKGMQQFALGLMGQFAGVYALAAAVQEGFRANLELSDAQASVMKTVGMTKDEVDQLAESFKRIDTRTTLKGLMDIAKIGGQFGVAERDIEGFAEATNMAAVALSDEFKGGVEEVATELYTLRGLFEDTKALSPEEAMLRIGSAINSLGASGAATGPVVAEFAKRLGQLGDMGPSIQTALGLGAALQELGLSAEIASGGYANIIIQLQQTKNAEKAAEYLGMTTDAFDRMLDSNPNDLLLELAKRLDGNVEKMREFGVMSQESIKVWNTMGTNAERVAELVALSNDEFERGTSISNEYAIANDTLAASWDKLWNKIRNSVTSGAIGDSLKGAIDGVLNLMREANNLAGAVYVNNAAASGRMAEAYALQSKRAEELVDAYNVLNQTEDYARENKEKINEIAKELQLTYGKSVVSIDKQTGAYTVNTAAVLAQARAKGMLVEQESNDTIERMRVTDEQVKQQREVVEAKEKEVAAIEAWLEKNEEMLWYSEETKAMHSALREAELDLGEATNMLTGLINDREQAMKSLTKAGYTQLQVEKMLADAWAKAADPVKQGEAIWGAGPAGLRDPNLAYAEDGIPTEGGTGGGKTERKTKTEGLDAAEEARHQLALLKVQIAETRAEWAYLAADFSDWEMDVDVADGLLEQLGYVQAEMEELDMLYQNQIDALDRLTQARIASAKADAAEKRQHNKGGSDGLALIEAQLNEQIANIYHEREIQHKELMKNLETAEQKNADRILKINKKAEEDRVKAVDAIMDKSKKTADAKGGFNDQYDKDVKEAEDWFESRRALEQALFDFGGEIGNAYFDMKQQRMAAEMEMLRYNYEQEIEAAGNNEQLKHEINQRYMKEELKLRQEQAKTQKQQAMYNIVLSTAMAVMNAMANVPAPFNFAVAGLVAGMGAAQLITAASQPTPKFYRGTESSPEGLARVGETGPEMAISPEGKIVYYDKPQSVYLKEGTQIKTKTQTDAILSQMKATYGQHETQALVNSFKAGEQAYFAPKQEAPSYGELVREMRRSTKETVRAIKSDKRQVNRNPDGSTTVRDGSKWMTYVNKKYNR